jgi:hypothetical protein
MPGNADPGERVRLLLRNDGRTYAQQAGIRLAGRPIPLCQLPDQLPVLAPLPSARISAGGREYLPARGARGLAAGGPCADDRMTEGARRARRPRRPARGQRPSGAAGRLPHPAFAYPQPPP